MKKTKIIWLAWVSLLAIVAGAYFIVWPSTDETGSLDAVTQSVMFDCSDPAVTVIESDCQALVDLYNATDGENWEKNNWWLVDSDVWNWFWISVSSTIQRVTKIELDLNNLKWYIPTSLWILENLSLLNLHWNELVWVIPDTLWDLSNLWTLKLSNNTLVWEIPSSLWNLSNLRELDLRVNRMAWEIPDSLWNLSELNILQLFNNELVWEIPNSLWNLSNLNILYLQSNKLTWEIPSSLWNLSNLWNLILSDNKLTWEIPPSIGVLPILTSLWLNVNELTWEIPSELWNLSTLINLDLWWNNLSWEIPESLWNLSNLTNIDLRTNKLWWEIPDSLWNLYSLEYMFLSINNLCWEIPQSIKDLNILYENYTYNRLTIPWDETQQPENCEQVECEENIVDLNDFDYNNDGTLTANDLFILQQILLWEMEYIPWKITDTNGDGVYDEDDVSQLLAYIIWNDDITSLCIDWIDIDCDGIIDEGQCDFCGNGVIDEWEECDWSDPKNWIFCTEECMLLEVVVIDDWPGTIGHDGLTPAEWEDWRDLIH